MLLCAAGHPVYNNVTIVPESMLCHLKRADMSVLLILRLIHWLVTLCLSVTYIHDGSLSQVNTLKAACRKQLTPDHLILILVSQCKLKFHRHRL